MGVVLDAHGLQWGINGLIVLAWVSHGSSVGLPWAFHFPTICGVLTHGSPMGLR